jgi:hypothetical protein
MPQAFAFTPHLVGRICVLLGESLVTEAAEGAVETVVTVFANAQAKGQASHNSVGERLLLRKSTEGASAASPA